MKFFHSSSAIQLLLGILLISCVLFRVQWFVSMGEVFMYSYHVFIFFGSLLIAYAGAKLVGLKGLYGLSILVAIESFLAILVYSLPGNQRTGNVNFFHKILSGIYIETKMSMPFVPAISEYNAKLGYLYKPNSIGKFKNWEFNNTVSINNIGLRDDDESANNPEIIALGDSFTAGAGLEQQETYPQQLEHITHRKVLNAGVSSYGTIRETLLLQQLDIDSCKWVILQFCINDIDENRTWADSLLQNKKYVPSFNKHTYDMKVLQDLMNSQYVPFKYFIMTIKSALIYFFKRNSSATSYQDIRYIPIHAENFLKTVQVLQRTYKGKILIISLFDRSKNIDSAFMAEVRKQNEKQNLPNLYFLDVHSYLSEKDTFMIDGHLNTGGAKKVAQEIAKFLSDFERSISKSKL